MARRFCQPFCLEYKGVCYAIPRCLGVQLRNYVEISMQLFMNSQKVHTG